MWEFYEVDRSQGGTPTDAGFDRITGAHNCGRRIPRK